MPRTKTKIDQRPREEPATATSSHAAATSGEVLTLAEVAAYLRVTEPEVLRFVREQRLPGRQMGDGWRFLKAAVAGWLSTPAAPDPRDFWKTQFGALKDDPYLKEMLKEIYRRRGRPEDGEL
jgi:excisionase family DNA binding protein